nr:MAG TPA: helix-turn-helix domain protein [Caudoviricetes sp.]
MSMLLMVQAMKAKVGNPLRKLVLVKLADQANDDGECWPSYQSIADACEMSRRTVITHIDWLEENGFLQCKHRKSNDGLSRSNVFVLTIGGGENPAPQGANLSPGGANAAPRGANAALPGGENPALGGANAAPIETVNESINIEPVKESVKESAARVRATPPAEPPPPADQPPPAKPPRFEPLSALLALGVDAQVAADWLAVRKAKRAALTQTALDGMVDEAHKAGISVAEAVRICAVRGWQGFKASWDWRDDKPQGRTFEHRGGQQQSAQEYAAAQAARIAERFGLDFSEGGSK